MQNELKLPNLQQRRQLSRLTIFYKAVNNQVTVDLTDYLLISVRETRSYHQKRFTRLSTFKINKIIYYMDIWHLHQVILQGCLEGLHCGLVFDVRWQVVPLWCIPWNVAVLVDVRSSRQPCESFLMVSYVFSPGCYANMRLSSIHVDVDGDVYSSRPHQCCNS
jgi:hypothetical protein